MKKQKTTQTSKIAARLVAIRQVGTNKPNIFGNRVESAQAKIAAQHKAYLESLK